MVKNAEKSEKAPDTGELRRVICADDDPGQRFLYERYLRGAGYEVRTVGNGQAVLNDLAENPADLLILDLQMPIMDGLTVLEHLRRDPDLYDLPVLIVSATESEATISQGLSLGARDFLVKPAREGELLAKVALVFRRQELASLTRAGFSPGSLFGGRYAIDMAIGSGGFASVYEATDVTSKERITVALKVLHLTGAEERDPRFIRHFLREAYEHSRLSHPNIVKLLDFGQSDNMYFLVMEYLEGLTVEEIVKMTGCLDEQSAVMLAYEVSKALQYLDSHALLHRDIKPQNIMITNEGTAKILDFGLARAINDETLSTGDEFRCSPRYASPEYIRGDENVDVRSDIYSLGVTLYYATSKNYPVGGTTTEETFRRHLTDQPRPLRQINPEISEDFGTLISLMLSKEPELRPSIGELCEMLEGLLDGPAPLAEN